MAIKLSFSDQNFWQQPAEAKVLFVEQDNVAHVLDEHVRTLVPTIDRMLADKKFTGKAQSLVVVPIAKEDATHYLIFAGLGKKNTQGVLSIESYRRVLGSLTRVIPANSITSLVMHLPNASLYGLTEHELAQQASSILLIADYMFDDFITDKDRKHDHNFTVTFVAQSNEKENIQHGMRNGELIAQAVNNARHWVDLPANILRPHDLAARAQDIAKEYGLECTVFGEETCKEMGMGGLAAVAAGSEQECRFVIMEYKAKDKHAPTLAIVGKGITFDSGGLSLKPASFMETMKEDMSGAAAVIATMKVIAQLKPTINVIAFAPMTENLPSGEATKPGDIVRFYNGKTAEIKNTDAEGRLILADALSYAVKHYKPDAIIDLATLTGACMHALGPFFTGLFSEHEDFTKRVEVAAERSGEYVWRLPLTKDYYAAIKSDVADLCNSGKSNYRAGATQAACFLQHFVDDVPWVHLDIAGTAFDVPDISYYRRSSATGVGVRLLVDLIMNWQK